MAEPKRDSHPVLARLGGVYEVSRLLRITKSSLADRRRHESFPKPIVELRCGLIWDLDEIDAYREARVSNPFAVYRCQSAGPTTAVELNPIAVRMWRTIGASCWRGAPTSGFSVLSTARSLGLGPGVHRSSRPIEGDLEGMLYAAIDIHKHVFQAAVLDAESGGSTPARSAERLQRLNRLRA